MKVVVPVLLILASIAIAGSLAWFFLASGSRGGELAREQRALPPFTRVAVEGFADVTLVAGAAEAVIVEAPAKRLARVQAEVSEDTLTISGDRGRRWWSGILGGGGRQPRITVVYRSLEGINAAGAVRIHAEDLRAERLKVTASGATSLRLTGLDARELALSGSGAMKAELSGRADAQRISISGAGSYAGSELVGEDARVMVRGAGRVVVNVEKTLDIGISGAGRVEYLGNPRVTEQISGAGRIKRRDAADARVQVAASSYAR